jgi:uncharacterized protein
MRCPRCAEGESLRLVMYGDVELDVCPKCHGIWLDAGEMTALMEWFTPADSFIQDTLACEGLVAHSGALDVPCPHDETPLKGCVVPKTDGLSSPTLDICPSCHGIWVDGGERAELHAILMKRQAAGLDTDVALHVPAPGWQKALRRVVPDALYSILVSRR